MKILLDLASIEVLDRQVWVTEHNSPKLAFSALSDGYLTSAGWFLDLVARWVALTERNGRSVSATFMSEMRGFVLIDEIDLHLHPRWQVEIIARTRKLLPQMSFVVTTHNPLTLVGANAKEIWILSKDLGQVNGACGLDTPMLLTGGQIYRRYFVLRTFIQMNSVENCNDLGFCLAMPCVAMPNNWSSSKLRNALKKPDWSPGGR